MLPPKDADGGRPTPSGPIPSAESFEACGALSMVRNMTFPPDGRVVHILATDGCDINGIRTLCAAFSSASVTAHVFVPRKGVLVGDDPSTFVAVDQTFLTASSVEADALIVAFGTSAPQTDVGVHIWTPTAFRHHKTIAAWGDGSELLLASGIGDAGPGLLLAELADETFAGVVLALLGAHRHWDRPTAMSPSVLSATKA